MQIAICDDQKPELLRISKLVDTYLCSHMNLKKVTVTLFSTSSDLLLEIEKGTQFDIFLLDVVMPDINGIELATKIRTNNKTAKIIFLTSSAEFAVDSYTVDAFNYLLKPVQEDRLFMALKGAFAAISVAKNDHIVVKTPPCLTRVFLHKLIYVEVIGRTIYFHQIDEPVVESNGAFFEIEAILLNDKRFIKPHRSYIMNLDYIKKLSYDALTTTTGTLIPVARKSSKNVKQSYIAYSFKSNL